MTMHKGPTGNNTHTHSWNRTKNDRKLHCRMLHACSQHRRGRSNNTENGGRVKTKHTQFARVGIKLKPADDRLKPMRPPELIFPIEHREMKGISLRSGGSGSSRHEKLAKGRQACFEAITLMCQANYTRIKPKWSEPLINCSLWRSCSSNSKSMHTNCEKIGWAGERIP